MSIHDTLDDPAAEIERIHTILDRHLPTIMFALGEMVLETATKSRDELTEREVMIRSAFSAVHWIAKDIVTPMSAEPLYDLPSVVDLMRTRKDSDHRAAVAALGEAAIAAVQDGIPGMRNSASSPMERELAVQRWLEDRANALSRGKN